MIRRLLIPLFSDIIIYMIAIVGLISNENILFILNKEFLVKFKQTDVSFKLQILFASLFFVISIVVIIINYIEYKKDSENKMVTLSFVKTSAPKIEPRSKLDDLLKVDGSLKLYLEIDNLKHLLLERSIKFGELISLSSSSEVKYTESVRLSLSKKKLIKSKFILNFEPSGDTIWTSDVYDRENLSDNLLDAKKTSTGKRQLIIHTKNAANLEYLNLFDEPDKVLQVTTNVQPNDEDKVPNIFKLSSKLNISIDNYSTSVFVNELQFFHEYAIMAELDKGISRGFLYYSIRTEIDIINIDKNTLICESVKLRDINNRNAGIAIKKMLKESQVKGEFDKDFDVDKLFVD